MPDNSVDSIVTDPPYELGFMGKSWDNSGIAYNVELWTECLRVLKPGGHLLAFGGSRTYHRLACAIEDAGFEVRDQIMWLYGCLDEQTEMLVDGKWISYTDISEGQNALAYDADNDEYSWQPVQRVIRFNYTDTAYRLSGALTNQLVTREHRCLVKSGDKFVFQEAQDVAQVGFAEVPVLQNVDALIDALTQPIEWSYGTGQSQTERDLRPMCDADVSPCFATSESNRQVLLTSMSQQGVSVEERRQFPTTQVRSEQSSVEGRSDLLSQARQLQADTLRSLPNRVSLNGTQGRLRDGASVDRSESDRSATSANRSGAPRESQSTRQPLGESVAILDQPRSQTVRASRFTTTDLVRVEPEHYDGVMWCVTVPSGAFVARRNGKVFVTGNSGFPKSLDVSKAIDKAAGAEREVIGSQRTNVGMQGGNFTAGSQAGDVAITAPATPEAQQWQGWGTALKPAFEPVIVAQKPLRNKDYCDWIGSHFATLQAWLQQEVENQIQTGEADDSFVPMDTSLSESATTTFLNIVSSWLNILADLYRHENMYTTSIASGMTTDWKTLHSLALKITPESITREQTNPSGLQSTVLVVGNLLSGAWLSLQGIQGLSAVESATDFTPERHPAGTEVSHEPIVLARKPLVGTVANNVLEWGTGALNIDGSRVGTEILGGGTMPNLRDVGAMSKESTGIDKLSFGQNPRPATRIEQPTYEGRWPANVIHDGSAGVVAGFPTSSSSKTKSNDNRQNNGNSMFMDGKHSPDNSYTDSGSAARFFYCAKAGKSERNAGLEGLPERRESDREKDDGVGGDNPRNRSNAAKVNFHPTVKPIALMRYLVKLVTPPGGTVLDPFLGSGTTACAAIMEGFEWLGCEMTEDYWPIIEARTEWARDEFDKIAVQPKASTLF